MRYQLRLLTLILTLMAISSNTKALSFYQDSNKDQLQKEVSEGNEIPPGAEDSPLNFAGPKSTVKINNPLTSFILVK